MAKGKDFTVASARCDQCLFGPDKVVGDCRRRDVLEQFRRHDKYFVCHKTKNTACRGWFETFSCTFSQIMARFRWVRFVAVEASMPEEADPEGAMRRHAELPHQGTLAAGMRQARMRRSRRLKKGAADA